MRKAVRISLGHENYLIYKFLIQFLSFGIGFILDIIGNKESLSN